MELGKRKRSDSATSDQSETLCYELLVRIFMYLNVDDLAVVSLVCKSWNEACRDPSLWNKIDLSRLTSYCFNIRHNTLSAFSDKASSNKMTQFLKHVLNLSNGKPRCIVFNYFVYLRDEQFTIVAERTPNLKRLVLPSSGCLSEEGINKAMKMWRDLESITITSMINCRFLFAAIGKYCKNITEIKFTCAFEEYHADALIINTPKLKVLSIRLILVSMKALCRVLNVMEHLEAVNICHSSLMDKDPIHKVVLYRVADLRRHLDVTHFKKIFFCQPKICLRCKNKAGNKTTSSKPYGAFEVIWREDEFISLAH